MRNMSVAIAALILIAPSLLAQSPAKTAGQAPSAATKATGAPDPWLARTTKVQFQRVNGPEGRFQLDYPKKDWMPVPGGGPVALTLASKKAEGALVVEVARLNQPLEPGDITDLFAQLETDLLKERLPKAADFQSKVLEDGGRRMVAIQFSRPGVAGPERARQYSLPAGKLLYRVTCAAGSVQFPAFDATCAHMAASFTIMAAGQ